MEKFKKIILGFVACIVIAGISKVLGSFVLALGASTFAIILGIILGNTVLNKKVYATSYNILTL